MYRKEVARFVVDEPISAHFTFSNPVEVNTKFGKQYRYSIIEGYTDYVFFATEKLNGLLQSVGKLSGRTLEIEKKAYPGGKNYWVIRENGVDITPRCESARVNE
jgi:hypothetical protein